MMNDKQLKTLLDTIERNLTDWIPIGVKELGIKSPAYCLFLWYQDFSDDFTPHYGIATQELLDAIEATHFEDPIDRFEMIWRPQQCADLDVPGRLVLDECDIVETEVEACYEILAKQAEIFEEESENENALEEDSELEDDLGDEEDLDEEDLDADEEAIEKEFQALAPFREMMHRVGKNLQQVDWKKIMPVSDNFIVLVGDYVGYWLAEDFEESVSLPKIDSLIAQGLLMAPPTEE
jgi:hypothetical protein